MDQIEIHQEIYSLLRSSPNRSVLVLAKNLIERNVDAREYFFFKADERWLNWLWKNGFLDAIKEKSDDLTRYSYTLPELEYLLKVSEKEPDAVVSIIQAVPISKETFNPEVADRFLRIISKLPPKNMSSLVSKICQENWVRLMGRFNRWGFEYKEIFASLAKTKDFENILALAGVVLSIRTEEERKETDNSYRGNNPFYFENLSETEVLDHLVTFDDAYAEAVLKLVATTLGAAVVFGEPKEEDSIFTIGDTFALFDVDFFTLKFGEKERISSDRDNVRELAAVVVVFLRRLLVDHCDDKAAVRGIYETYIKPLPDSRALWRLRLFTLSLCPDAFKEEIHEALFRIFETKNYGELIMGAEYERLVQVGFQTLDMTDRKQYIQKMIALFSQEADHKGIGRDILSSALPFLTVEEKSQIEQAFGRLKEGYVPEPSFVSSGFAGQVIPRSAGSDEEWAGPITDIVEKLKGEWSSHTLAEKYRDREYHDKDFFHHPIGVNGTGDRIKSELKKRTQAYINNAHLFFDREQLHPHYTYSYLGGLCDLLKEGTHIREDDSAKILALLRSMVLSGEERPFETAGESVGISWTANWQAVYYTMADLLKVLLSSDDNKPPHIAFTQCRDDIFALVRALIAHPSPTPEIEESKYSPEREQYTGSDSYTVAINSVRGRVFEVLLHFVYQDGKRLKALGDTKKIAADVQELYEQTLQNEKTQAIMFLFGHHLPSFYYRDAKWIQGLLPSIFPEDVLRKDLYLSAWEGYVSNNLYIEMFRDASIEKLYRRAIQLSPEEYTKRSYFRNLDEGLGTHLALAFVHYADFTMESDLFKLFWATRNIKRHNEFISFIGRYCISRDGDSVFSSKESLDAGKLKQFWEYALTHCQAEELDGFGFWIPKGENIFGSNRWLADMVGKTLGLSKGGTISERGLMEMLPVFVNEAPRETLVILRSYLLGERNDERKWFSVDDNLLSVFQVLIKNDDTKEDTRILINDLITKYSNRFWRLEEVLPRE